MIGTYFQGLGAPLYWLMALRLTEASSSDWPPERNTTPGMAGGTVRASAVTVALATSSGLALTPGMNICQRNGMVMNQKKRFEQKNVDICQLKFLADHKMTNFSFLRVIFAPNAYFLQNIHHCLTP